VLPKLKLQFGILSILTTVWFTVLLGYREKVAADGSKFEIYEIIYTADTSATGYGGIAYHHVTNILLCLLTHLWCVGGCLYFGWAVENSSDIQPDTLHADTQGQSG